MRKIKKSVKIIISLACVLAVAVAGVVTAVLINNSRKNKGKNPPSVPAYALTASQKELGREIISSVSTAISNKKLQPVEYSSSLSDVLSVSKISHLDKNVAWSKVSQYSFNAYVLDSEGNPSELLQFIKNKGLVRDDYIRANIDFASKNHFSVLYTYSQNEFVRIVCSVENGDVVLHKSFELIQEGAYARFNNDLFWFAFDGEFFVAMLKNDGVYHYEMFDYLSDYTNYESFKVDVVDELDTISCTGGIFCVDGQMIASKGSDGKFALIESSENNVFSLESGMIVETKTEYLSAVDGAELVDGKYFVYSYKLVASGEEKTIELASGSKITAVPYSGDKFFGIFVQTVDVTGSLNETGTMIYYNYELETIVKYSARSASLSKIFYASDDSFLTGDGVVSGKTSVVHNKIYDYETNGYEFVNILGNGDIVLKNSNGGMIVFDKNLSQSFAVSFDEIVSRLNDDSLIFIKNDKYYIYDIKNRVSTQIEYVKSSITNNTSMYFVKNEGGLSYSLYSGTELVDDEVTSYNPGDNYLTFTSNSIEKSYYFVDKLDLIDNPDGLSFSATNNSGGSLVEIDPSFGAPAVEPYDSIFDEEPEWYEYEDKFQSVPERNAGGTLTGGTVYKATHCIQMGYYSKTDYVDYLEIRYNGDGKGSNYAPYRVYYRVDISSGNPEVSIISKGHHLMSYMEVTDEVDYSPTKCINVNGKMYEINDLYSLGDTRYPPNNWAYDNSYDYTENVGGALQPSYYYTDSSDALTGFFFHDTVDYVNNRPCTAEVYGNSIRVTLYFTFVQRDSASIIEDQMKFGQNKQIPGVEEHHYYNDLYYQSVVIGYLSEKVNYYTDIIESPETGENSIVTEYFFDSYLNNPASNFDAKDRTNQQLFFSADSSSAIMTACVSSKTYISDITKVDDSLEYGYKKLYLGGKNFKTNIVGGQLVGITTINEANYNNINIKSLYSTESTSGSRNYFDERVEFRLIPVGESTASGEDNDVNIVKYTYLNYDNTEGSENYSINIQNQDYIYYAGGLNSFRYIYCVFEPQMFYVDIDYNASGETASFGNEINYLQSYASLNVGLDYRNDYVSYNKSWVYVNALETGTDESKVFGTYDNANNDKYWPYDFENTDTRAEPIDLQKAISNGDGEAYKKKYENSARIFEYKNENQRYFYVVIDGVKYYFQNNFKDESGANLDYSKPYSEKFVSDGMTEIFVTAYKVSDAFVETTSNGYGKIDAITSTAYYDAFFKDFDAAELEPGKTGREGVYDDNVDFVYLHIKPSEVTAGTYVAYYYEENKHIRDNIVYNGYYNFIDDGTGEGTRKVDEVNFNDADGTKYSISESFSFLYSDNLIMTRLPQHTHYDFMGWKVLVPKPDGTYFEYMIDTTELATIEINLNTNLSSEHPFLPEYDGEHSIVGYKFFDFWRLINADGTITWKNLLDNPIKLVAQWQPKKCDVKAVLYIPQTSGGATKYLGLRHDYEGTYGYTLTNNFDIADGATSAPIFKKGTTDLDTNKDGILDFSAETKFDYSLDVTFFNIGTLMANNSFSQNIVNTTGLSCQFMGWAFQQKTANEGESADTFIAIDPLLNNEPKDQRAKDTKIDEYIGDTTTITIYAYYATSRYNFYLRFYPMGGATLAEDGANKSYYSNYDYHTGVSGNGNIYNALRNPAIYDIIINDFGTVGSNYEQKYTSDPTNNSVNVMGLTDKAYGIDYRDENNPFFTGNGVMFKVTLNEQYYARTIVISNLVLRDDTAFNNLDVFKLTFTYNYTDEGGAWTGTCVSQTRSGYSLEVKPTTGGSFAIGMNNGERNSSNNTITIQQPNDDSVGTKTWTISIGHLSNPGKMDSVADYSNQLLEGNDGFTLEVHPASYTIETEKVTVSTKDLNDEDTVGPFDNNNAMLVSSQPLTNAEGYEISAGSPVYIWLGTSRYMFADEWDTNILSGYYRMNPNGSTVAVEVPDFDYEQFMDQHIQIDGELYVYYDKTEARVYYPAKYAGANERRVDATRTHDNIRYWFELGGVRYYINYNLDGTYNSVNFLGGYCLAHTSQTGEFGFDSGANYKNPDYHYKVGAETIAVKIDMVYGGVDTALVTYRVFNETTFSIGYNNTRVLAIDPDQEKVYISEKPAASVESDYYDLKYYLSSITIGTTTISFDIITRNIINSTTETATKFYGLLNLELMEGNNYVSAGTLQKLTQIHNTNEWVAESGGDPHDSYVINYFGENYIIQDAYIININPISGRVGAETYYFYLTRSEKGFTRYFLIYDESTTKLSDLKLNYEIELTFKEFKKNLEITATEEDLYDATNRSFEIMYAEKSTKFTDGKTIYKYGFDNTIDYEDIIADSTKTPDKNKFYQLENPFDVPFETIKTSTENIADLRGITSMKWRNTYDFTPSANRRLKISAKSGYIIKKLKVYIGTKDKTNPADDEFVNLISFEFIDESLDYLYYYDTGMNYSYSSIEDNKLVSYISYKINRTPEGEPEQAGDSVNIGYRVIANQTFGLYYSSFYDTNWGFGHDGSFNFDHLYLMLGGLYEDVKIELETTSYSEYVFESGAENDGYNPLLRVDDFQTQVNSLEKHDTYYDIPLSMTYLFLYTMKYENPDDEELILDKELLMNAPATGDDKIFTIRYYFDRSQNNIMRHSIRIIFFGTGSKVRYGLHFLSTHKDYSVYFTNGRYYNEQIGSDKETPFKELEAFSGRTSNNNAIVVDETTPANDTRAKTNKLVYMFTGELHNENNLGKYTGFFVSSSYIVTNESSFKFLMAVTAFVNEVGVKTESYLYNHTMTIDQTLRPGFSTDPNKKVTTRLDSTVSGNVLGEGEYNGENYNYLHKNDGNEIIFNKGSNFYHYQLDTLHKTNSWFNDTVLSNIQLYSYLDTPDTEPEELNVWANRNAEGESILSRVEMGGLDFNWRYYEIPGYYLKYLLVKIADIQSYFMVDISALNTMAFSGASVEDNKLTLVKELKLYNPNAVDGRSYSYRFNLYYYRHNKNGQTYSYYQLYPIFGEEKDNGSGGKEIVIDEFESVSLMANDITIGFVSNAYNYEISFENYDFEGKVSTESTLQKYATSGVAGGTQTIYYDSMTKINHYQTMTGYTFIGWGSETYYNSGTQKLRFEPQPNADKSTPSIWDSTSVWFDTTTYFAQTGKSAEENMGLYLKLKDAYRTYSNATFDDIYYNKPYGAFYADGGYFVTDTGIKNPGLTAQNYNFYADYVDVFARHISQTHMNYQNELASDNLVSRTIKLYAIWKANTYAIEFDVNNSEYNDTVYIDYETKAFVYEFTSDKIGFRDKTKVGVNQEVRLCYVTFDTNNWYSLSGTGSVLMYSAKTSSSGGSPYSISSLVDGTVAKLAVDMFGYSWLGWYYTRAEKYIEQDNSVATLTRVFDSYYSSVSNTTGNSKLPEIPVFDKKFVEMGVTVFELDFDLTNTDTANAQKFIYHGRHKEPGSTLNPNTGYVCFYYYGHQSIDSNNEYANFGNASKTFEIEGADMPYIMSADYLNSFRTYTAQGVGADGYPVTETRLRYAGEYISPIIMSYYDTFMGENCYSIRSSSGRYSLSLSSNAADLRRVKLFANWSQNKYQLIFNDLSNSGTQFDWDRGSSDVESNVWVNFAKTNPSSWQTVWFNNQAMATFMLDKYQPTRIGYDFVGWSYNYIPTNTVVYESLIQSVNTPNQYSYLCKELLAGYASMNGATKTSDLESNVLMISSDRTSSVRGSNWILNEEGGNAERLGDSEIDNNRYVYVFPIWKAQTFSINISMNIAQENLKNLHEKDSSFAVALYDSADANCKTSTGVNSKYYTYNNVKDSTNVSGSDVSNLYYYYNDIVANVCFEIEFDKPFSTATCSFGGKTYYLKDLMMTSAGYYFLGLMAQNDESDQYVVKNLLRTTLEYRDGLVHHKGKEDDEEVLDVTNVYNNETYLSYGQITGKDESGNYSDDTDVFNLEAYYAMKDEKYYSNSNLSSKSNLNSNDYNATPYMPATNSTMFSSNFGYISFQGKNYSSEKINNNSTMPRTYNIMSERDGSDYYLYIIHNNIKYYVVYYNMNGTSFEDNITFDRTYLYYNVKDGSGNVLNKYAVRFDSANTPYYVDNTFKNRKTLTLYIALYTTKTNKLNINTTGSSATIVEWSATNPNGSLTVGSSWNNATKKVSGSIAGVIGNSTFELYNRATREFTLYADWEIRTIKSVIENGNNTGSTAQSNFGLGGYYEIDNNATGNSAASKTDVDSLKNNPEKNIELTYEYYSNIDHMFLPFYAGRYLSELTLEFDTLLEEGSSDTTTFSKRHNTIVFNFKWNNDKQSSKQTITIESVTFNGLLVASSIAAVDKSGGYKLNAVSGIDILSMIDYRSMNDANNNSGIELYKYGTYNEISYVNKVCVDLTKVMTSMKFTCKYSIQTYLVEVYSVVADSDFTTKYYSSFSSETAMHQASNYYPENRGLYGVPYISSESYATGAIPTISTDCAKVQTMSYNVPFYYFVTDKNSSHNTVASNNFGAVRKTYGLDYIYGGIYTSGSSGTPINSTFGALYDLKIDGYSEVVWLTNPVQEGSVISFSQYNQEKPIIQNTRIYGYYYKEDSPTKVLFYYWNNETNTYVQYTQNESDYTSTTGSSIKLKSDGNYHIEQLPSPTIATWYGGGAKQFVGYVYITSEVFNDFISPILNEEYNSAKYQASNTFSETRGDVYSANYMNRVVSTYSGSTHFDNFQNYLNGISLSSMFSSRLLVQDYKYFTKSANVNGHSVKILDGVRVAIKISEDTFYKDLKMLNVDTKLPTGQTTYAIPIYEDLNMTIKDIFVYKDEATITSNTNMIQSCVFETHSKYTIFYDPRDVKIAVTSSSSLGVSNLVGSASDTFGLDDINKVGAPMSEAQKFDYRKKTFPISSTSYVYAYYEKADGTPFFVSNAYKVTSGQVRVQTKVEMYDSPLDIKLSNHNLETYRVAYEAIEDDDTITSEIEKTNRKRVVYIMLQLLECAGLSNTNTTSILTYSNNSGSTRPDSYSTGDINIKECIRSLNYKNQAVPIVDSTFVAGTVYYDYFSIYRLAYSLAYEFTTTEYINYGTGLQNLFAGRNSVSEYYMYAQNQTTKIFVESSSTTIKPGDIMTSFRHTGQTTRTIYNVEGDDKVVYFYEPDSRGSYEWVYDTADFAMYLGAKNDTIYFANRHVQLSFATTDYQSLEEDDFQERDTYKKFTHGTGDDGNGKESGYYTRNATTQITETTLNGGYFMEGARKLKVYYNGKYFTESDIDNESDSAIAKYYTEYKKNWDDTILKEYNEAKKLYDEAYERYEKEYEEYEEKCKDYEAYQKWQITQEGDPPNNQSTRPVAPTLSVPNPGDAPTYTKPALAEAVNAVTSNPSYYNLETFSVYSEGKGYYLKSDKNTSTKISSKYYEYTANYQYYIVDENGERTKLSHYSTPYTYYSGYDNKNTSSIKTKWIVCGIPGDLRIYTRWTSYFGNTSATSGEVVYYDDVINAGLSDGSVLGGGSYPDGLPTGTGGTAGGPDVGGSGGDGGGGGVIPPIGPVAPGEGDYTGGVLGEEVDPSSIGSPLTFELKGDYKDLFLETSKRCADDIYRLTLVKVALQILQGKNGSSKSSVAINYQYAVHFYGLASDYNGLVDKPNFCNRTYSSDSDNPPYCPTSDAGSLCSKCYNTKKKKYSLTYAIQTINSGKKIYTDCFGYVRLAYCIAGYQFFQDAPNKYTSVYEWRGGYNGAKFGENNIINKLDVGTCIQDQISGGKNYNSDRHVAMYLYVEDDGTVHYVDQGGIRTGTYVYETHYSKSGAFVYRGYHIKGTNSRAYRFCGYEDYLKSSVYSS